MTILHISGPLGYDLCCWLLTFRTSVVIIQVAIPVGREGEQKAFKAAISYLCWETQVYWKSIAESCSPWLYFWVSVSQSTQYLCIWCKGYRPWVTAEFGLSFALDWLCDLFDLSESQWPHLYMGLQEESGNPFKVPSKAQHIVGAGINGVFLPFWYGFQPHYWPKSVAAQTLSRHISEIL